MPQLRAVAPTRTTLSQCIQSISGQACSKATAATSFALFLVGLIVGRCDQLATCGGTLADGPSAKRRRSEARRAVITGILRRSIAAERSGSVGSSRPATDHLR